MVKAGYKCLVTAPSNVATDNLLEKVSKKFPTDVVRLCSTANEYREGNLAEFSLHRIIHQDEYMNKWYIYTCDTQFLKLNHIIFLAFIKTNFCRCFKNYLILPKNNVGDTFL